MVERIGDALPLSWEALNRGDLTLAHLKVLSTSTRACMPRVAEAVDARVVPQAIARGWTPTQLANAARRAVIALDPDGAEDRAVKAKQYGDVSLYAEDHECATLVATGDALPLRNVMDAIEHRAEALGRDGDVRPIGQRRIDALAQYVLGEQAVARPTIQTVVTIDLTTLLGLTERPGELSGYGPITAETARRAQQGRNAAPADHRPDDRHDDRPRCQLPPVRRAAPYHRRARSDLPVPWLQPPRDQMRRRSRNCTRLRRPDSHGQPARVVPHASQPQDPRPLVGHPQPRRHRDLDECVRLPLHHATPAPIRSSFSTRRRTTRRQTTTSRGITPILIHQAPMTVTTNGNPGSEMAS